jgi:hypothetical protein
MLKSKPRLDMSGYALIRHCGPRRDSQGGSATHAGRVPQPINR